jgi:putative transposase
MKHVGQRHAQYVNRTYRRTPGRCGRAASGRASCSSWYFLRRQRYIELNPVRAGMVLHPADYRWSSYRENARHATCLLLTPHA